MLVLIFSLYKSSAFADYIVTGKITGMECGMFGIKCKIVNVDAVKKDGQLYQLRGSYEKVSEYNKSKKRCWIKQGFFSDDHYEKQEDGTYKKVDLEYFTFPCIKQ